MLKNIELIKTQLSELAGVINLYKSEAVQLKIVELVFKHATSGDSPNDVEKEESPVKRRGKRTQKSVKTTVTRQRTQKAAAGAKKRSSRLGAAAALERLLDTGFFKTKRKMADIVNQCATKLASPIKRTSLSGPLARFVHDEKLDRDKNKEDGQYEYIQK
jgi:uncharacterized protein (DUF2336 family)